MFACASHLLSSGILEDDLAGQAHYRSAIVNVVSFAVEKLNDKGWHPDFARVRYLADMLLSAVYANTLVFSGRIFALAFFRIEGVALKLLRALPTVKRQFVKRVLEEAGISET